MDAGRLFRLAKELERVALSQATDARESPSPAVVAVAADIARHPGTSMREVQDRTGYSQGAVSKAVAELRAEGRATVTTDAADRRRTVVTITPETMADLRDRGDRPLSGALAALGLSPADAARAETLLDEVAGLLLPQGRRPTLAP